jgi:hypothetical protein
MKASIKANFSVADIKKIADRLRGNFDKKIIETLSIVGEKFVINARNNGDYSDHSGNLRSSVRFFILKDGKLVGAQNTFVVRPVRTKNGKLAKRQPVYLGDQILAEIAEKYPKGYVLLGIAGMEYAAYVESRNKDVITGSAITAEDDLRKALDQFREELSGKKR